MTEIDNPEFESRPENPYSKSYYDLAKKQATHIVDRLKHIGLSDEQTYAAFETMYQELGLVITDTNIKTGRATQTETSAKAENESALTHAKDWTKAVALEGMLDVVQRKKGIPSHRLLFGHNDAPQNKYQEPKR
jgi:hypothetical protein